MKPYKPAKIYRGSRSWFVFYSYLNGEGKYQRFIVKRGINRFKGKEREAQARVLCDAINESLAAGVINPFSSEADPVMDANPLGALQGMTLKRALAWALEKRRHKVAQSSYMEYRRRLRHLLPVITRLQVNHRITEVRKFHIKTVIAHLATTNNIRSGTQNNYIEFVKTMFTELVDWEVIEMSPVASLKKMAREESRMHEPLTDDELKAVSTHLKAVHYPMYVLTKIIFRCLIRFEEVLSIKREHVHPTHIDLRPQGANSKKKNRSVPIDQELYEDILSLGSEPGQYIFSRGLKPGPTRSARNTPNYQWQNLVQGHLGIKKTPYALKATGVDRRLQQGNTIGDVQRGAGHSSPLVTRIYDKHNREKQLADERLREVAPTY